jgi:ketosteroid isomerase-like protein
MRLYALDAVVMPADKPVEKGAPTIRQYFLQLFRETSFNLTITPVEVTTSGDWAFARVEVTGTRTQKAVGKPDRLANKALLILQLSADGSWRIARYIFNRNAAPSDPQP